MRSGASPGRPETVLWRVPSEGLQSAITLCQTLDRGTGRTVGSAGSKTGSCTFTSWCRGGGAEASRLPATETRRVPKTERAAGGLGRLETGGPVDWIGSHTASKPESAAWPSHAASKTPAGATSCGVCGSFGSQGHRRFDAVSLPVTEVRLRQLSHWWRV